MPAIVGPLQIMNVGGGVVQFGDSAFISPKTSSKTSAGSGTLTTGAFVLVNNFVSLNNTIDFSLVDQPTVGNN